MVYHHSSIICHSGSCILDLLIYPWILFKLPLMANDVCKSLGSGKLPGEEHATRPTKATSEKWWISMNCIRMFFLKIKCKHLWHQTQFNSKIVFSRSIQLKPVYRRRHQLMSLWTHKAWWQEPPHGWRFWHIPFTSREQRICPCFCLKWEKEIKHACGW